jgi:hypothetical protein
MENMYYIGLDVHKKTISYCVKDGSGRIYAEAEIPATRLDLDMWMKTLPQPWTVAMEATIFTAWIYDHLKPHAAAVKVAHPLMLRAIAAAKKKNDRIDAHKIADCLRCDFLPECYMASTEIRERRRTLRYRNLLVRQAVQMKNKIAVLLMEAGVSYNKQKLHKVGYFRELLAQTRRPYELRTTGARGNYHLIKHVQRPLQLLHLQLSVHSVQMGLVRTESQSPEPSARSNLGEIPPSLSLQQLFPISSSSSLQYPDVSTYVLNCQVTSCLSVHNQEALPRLAVCKCLDAIHD